MQRQSDEAATYTCELHDATQCHASSPTSARPCAREEQTNGVPAYTASRASGYMSGEGDAAKHSATTGLQAAKQVQ